MKLDRFTAFMLLIFLGLILVSTLAGRVGIHDAGEYITIAKAMAGYENVPLFSAHSVIYPLFLAPFIKIWPSLTMLKIISVFWLIGTALILKKYYGKKAFLLFALSPIVWFMTVEVSPILPVTFFFTLSYYFIDKWKKEKKTKHLIYSGFLVGVCTALWGGALILVVFLFLVYLLNEKAKLSILLLIAFIAGYSTTFITDQIVFGYFLQTTLTYFGANLTTLFGLGSSKVPELTLSLLARALFWISPVLVFLIIRYKKEYKRELLLILLFLVFFYFRSGHPRGIKYFIIIAPLVAIALGNVLTQKEVAIVGAVGIIIAVFIVLPPHFYALHDISGLYKDDLIAIQKDGHDTIIAGPSQATEFAMILFEDKPQILWYEDFELHKKGITEYSRYSYKSPTTKLPLTKQVNVDITLTRTQERDYTGLPIVLPKDRAVPDPDFDLEKCYEVLCVYTPKKVKASVSIG